MRQVCQAPPTIHQPRRTAHRSFECPPRQKGTSAVLAIPGLALALVPGLALALVPGLALVPALALVPVLALGPALALALAWHKPTPRKEE